MTAHYADVSDADSVQACINEVIKEHGKIDNLVTSAGFTENYNAVDYPIDRMRKLWAVNVDGTYLFAVTIAKHLMERKAPGSMVFIGSMSGSIVNVPQPQAYVFLPVATPNFFSLFFSFFRESCVRLRSLLRSMNRKTNRCSPSSPYNSAKAAVRHLAASLAVEWADANIRVNCISPGYMLTAL